MQTLIPHIQPFFGWLVQTTLIASVVICLILLIQRTLGGKLGPRWCHALWLVLLLRMVLPWAPSSRLSLSNLIPSWDQKIQHQQRIETAEQKDFPPKQTAETSEAIPGQERKSEFALQTPVTPKQPEIAHMEGESGLRFVSIRRVLPILWLAGALIIGAYLLMSNFALWRVVKRDRPLLNQSMLELFEECKAQMGVQSLVVVVPSGQIRSPALFGFIRPRLLLPLEMLEKASHEEMRYVFLHELAHLRRHDIYLGWLASLLQVLHWFNPLVWFAFYRMRADREFACDALVLARAQKEESQEYGQAIISLVRRFSRSRPLPAMAGIIESKSQLKRRIAMITQFKNNSYRWSLPAIALIVAICCVSLPNAVGSKEPHASWPESEPSISLRRIKTGSMSDFSSVPSLDGKYLCDIQYRPTRLIISDLVTGKTSPLTEPTEGYFWCQAISPDSKYVAYVHQTWSPSVKELHLIDIDGTGRRVLYRFEEDEMFHIRAWTPDGKKIIGAFEKRSTPLQLVAFSVEDGSMQILHTFETYWPMWQSPLHKVAISPDGRYIAYDRPPEKGSWNSDIYVLDIENQRAECVLQHPAYDKLLDWTPDGRHIFFKSDRRQGVPGGFTATGTWDAYFLSVANGKSQGAPILVKHDIPDKLRPKGFTRDGTYYYAVEFRTIEVAMAKLDLKIGKLQGRPQVVGQTGADQIPTWSPDGRYLAYCTHELDDSQTIRIQDIATGRERKLDPNLPHFTWLRWSPDGKSFIVSNFAKNSPRAIYRIDAETGERLSMIESDSSETLPGEPQLSPDGNTLFYVLRHLDSKKESLLARDIKSGHEKELFALDDTEGVRGLSFTLSPDGWQLALATQVKASSGDSVDRRISIMPAKGGEPKELCKPDGLATQQPLAWTPNGQALLFTKRVPEGGRELWFVPTAGGPTRRLCGHRELMCQGMMYGSVHNTLDMHPDGQRIAFDCFEYRHEVWALENFLPKAPVVESAQQPNFKKIRIPTEVSWDMRLSPDGKQISLVSDKKLWIMPAAGQLAPNVPGEPAELDTGGVLIDRAAHAWSADGKWIAFNEETSLDNNEEKGNAGIYVIPSKGGTPKKVYETYRDHRTVNYRISLSPDGKILAFSSVDVKRKEQHIYTIPADGGQPKRLVDMQAREPAFSPDGSMIAFVEDGDMGRSGGGLWVVPAQGGTPKQVADAETASSPVWSPGGDMIAFLDYGAKKERINFVHIARDGRVIGVRIQIGTPEGIKGVWLLAGWDPDNRIGAIFERPAESGLYTLSAKGGKAMQVAYGGGHPRWSPDGERLFCVKVPEGDKGAWQQWAVGSFPGDGGAFTMVPLQSDVKISLPNFGAGNRVSPNGKQIVFSGKSHRKQPIFMHNRIWTVPVDGGIPTQLTKAAEENISDMFPCWSPDGHYIAYVHARFPDKMVTVGDVKADIYVIRKEGGTPKALTTESDGVSFGPIAWSPDGEYIAYYSQVDETTTTGILKIASINGGGPSRIIGNVDKPHPGKEITWSPDSKRIAFSGSDGKTISIISVKDGMTVNIDTGLVDARVGPQLDWSPDGKRFVFSGGKAEGSEFWMIENFLTESTANERVQ